MLMHLLLRGLFLQSREQAPVWPQAYPACCSVHHMNYGIIPAAGLAVSQRPRKA